MNSVDLQTRKLTLIEKLIILNDEAVFAKIDSLIDTTLPQSNLMLFTKSDIQNRARLSNKDIENGDLISQEEVEKMFEDL